MGDIYEITRRELYLLVAAATLLSIMLVILGFVLGKNMMIPERFPSVEQLADRSRQIDGSTALDEEIKNLRTSTADETSNEPFVKDEGLSFYKKLELDGDTSSAEASKDKKADAGNSRTEKVNLGDSSINNAERDAAKQSKTEAIPTPKPSVSPTATPNPRATVGPNFSEAFVVQVSSVKRKAFAEETLKKLQNKGYPAYISRIKFNTGIVNYRVRVGPFATRDTANRVLSEIRDTFRLSPLVMRVKDGKI